MTDCQVYVKLKAWQRKVPYLYYSHVRPGDEIMMRIEGDQGVK